MNLTKLKLFMLPFIVTIFAISLTIFPKQSLEASIKGLSMWWEVVFPSLLPFFIVSELLIGLGVVSFVGVLFEPLMRPLFRVPGSGGFVWAMGIASGFPAGAKYTARLRQEKKISAIEGERLVSFTNSSNPLFMFGAIAVGFFHDASLGVILAICHYLANFFVGIVMRYHGSSGLLPEQSRTRRRFSFRLALRELYRARLEDSRPLGKLLGDAVHSSVMTLLMIGGFIILFSVLNRLLGELQITAFVSTWFQLLLIIFHLPTELSLPFLSGLFEITLGAQMVSETGDVSLMHQTIIVSFILAFNGLSIQAQVASILANTDIRFKPFFFARILQGIFAALLTFFLWKPLYGNEGADGQRVIDVFAQRPSVSWIKETWERLLDYGPSITFLTLIIFIIISLKKGKVRADSIH